RLYVDAHLQSAQNLSDGPSQRNVPVFTLRNLVTFGS
ncbi:MAG: hypothetical protein RLZZ538_1513, partial [Actinomycetota bacterium]